MSRNYYLNDMNPQDFESLVVDICRVILGEGTVGFAPGKDGGKDARFEGVANNFPSKAGPLKGVCIIQAKHSSKSDSACGDADFRSTFSKEKKKIRALHDRGELEHYILFTNRKKTANDEETLRKQVSDVGLKSFHLLGRDDIHLRLDGMPDVVQNLSHLRADFFTLDPRDLTEVILGFHSFFAKNKKQSDQTSNFDYVGMKKKNKVNGLSREFFDNIRRNSLSYFQEIENFLENPRNIELNDLYEDMVDELRQKIIADRKKFGSFDEVLVHLRDLIAQGNEALKARKRYANIFLHYMYCNCDIGSHD